MKAFLEVIPADTFRVWFDNIRVGHMDDDGCELITPNEFSAIWIRDNYLDVIRQEADRLVGYPYTVELLGAYDEDLNPLQVTVSIQLRKSHPLQNLVLDHPCTAVPWGLTLRILFPTL